MSYVTELSTKIFYQGLIAFLTYIWLLLLKPLMFADSTKIRNISNKCKLTRALGLNSKNPLRIAGPPPLLLLEPSHPVINHTVSNHCVKSETWTQALY